MRAFVTISGLYPRSAKLLYFVLRKKLLSSMATHRMGSDTGSFLDRNQKLSCKPVQIDINTCSSKFVLISGSTLYILLIRFVKQ